MKACAFCFLIVLLHFSANAQFFSKKKKGSDKTTTQSNPVSLESEYYFSEGMKEFILDNYAKAAAWFEKAKEKNKDNAAIYYQIAQCYARTNNMYKAIEYGEKSIELEEGNKYYYLLLAQIYERKQDYNEAVKVYQKLLKKVPHSEEFNLDLAAVFIMQGKLDDAIKCYDKAEKSLGLSEEIIIQKQSIYLKEGKVDAAIAEWKKLAEAFPDEPRYTITIAELLLNNNRVAEAEKMMNELMSKKPGYPYGNLVLSDIYKQKGDKQKSQELLRLAFESPDLDIDPKVGMLVNLLRLLPNEEVKKQCIELGDILVKVHSDEAKSYAMNGDILTIGGKSKEALDNYLNAIKLDNTHFKIWQQIVLLDAELNHRDSLVKHSAQAIELFPTQSVFWFYNGVGQQLNKNYKKAVVSFEEGKKLVTKDKKMLTQFNLMLGDSYNGIKEYHKSDDAFEEVLKNEADNHVALNNYSYYLSLRKEKLEYAKKMSEKVIKGNPDNATYLDTYAWILYELKEFKEAKEIFEKIVDKTNNGTIVEHYGDVLYKMGDGEKAVLQWRKAKELGDASELIEKKIADKKLYE